MISMCSSTRALSPELACSTVPLCRLPIVVKMIKAISQSLFQGVTHVSYKTILLRNAFVIPLNDLKAPGPFLLCLW